VVRQAAALAGGGGGGRADSAMAGAKDLSRLDGALASVEKIVANMVK
jgi:alanyl-tRNA synthetase